MPPEGAFKMRHIGHHEAQRSIRVGELALQIQKIRARNMPGLERVTPGHGKIRLVAALGGGFEIGGTIEQAQVCLTQHVGEFRGGDEFVTPRHGRLP